MRLRCRLAGGEIEEPAPPATPQDLAAFFLARLPEEQRAEAREAIYGG